MFGAGIRRLSCLLVPLVTACAGDDEPSARSSTSSSTSAGTEDSSSQHDASTTGSVTVPADTSSTGPGNATGPDDSTGIGDSSGTGDSTDDTEGEQQITCAPGRVCVSPTPDGWNGPVGRNTIPADDGIPPCGEDFSQLQVSDAFSGLETSDYACDCDCGTDDITCAGIANLRLSNDVFDEGLSPCTAGVFPFDEPIASDNTQSVSYNIFNGVRGVVVDDYTSEIEGQCSPNPTITPTPAAFGERTVACRTFDIEEDACIGGDICIPAPVIPFEPRACVWQDGDLECPADTSYTERTVYHRSLADTRDCSTCSCGGAQGDCEDEELVFEGVSPLDGSLCLGTFNSWCATPGDPTFALDELSTCEPLRKSDFHPCSGICFNAPDVHIEAITYLAGTPTASCDPQGGEPTGTASGSDAVTFCCAAP